MRACLHPTQVSHDTLVMVERGPDGGLHVFFFLVSFVSIFRLIVGRKFSLYLIRMEKYIDVHKQVKN